MSLWRHGTSLWNDIDVIRFLHRYPFALTRTAHVCLPRTIGVAMRKDPIIHIIHMCYYTYKPR